MLESTCPFFKSDITAHLPTSSFSRNEYTKKMKTKTRLSAMKAPTVSSTFTPIAPIAELKDYITTSTLTERLIAFNFAIFAWQMKNPNVTKLGCKNDPDLDKRQYYRFLTSIFLHTSWVNVFSTAFSLSNLG